MARVLSLFVAIAVMVAVGSVSAQEKEGKKKEHKRPTAEQIFQKMDKDGNGKVTKEEFLANPRFKDDEAKKKAGERFEKIDTDNSGDVSLDEFKEAMKKMAEGHKKGGKKGDRKKKAE